MNIKELVDKAIEVAAPNKPKPKGPGRLGNVKSVKKEKETSTKPSTKDMELRAHKARFDFIYKQMKNTGGSVDAFLTVKEATMLQKKFPDLKTHLSRFKAFRKVLEKH